MRCLQVDAFGGDPHLFGGMINFRFGFGTGGALLLDWTAISLDFHLRHLGFECPKVPFALVLSVFLHLDIC